MPPSEDKSPDVNTEERRHASYTEVAQLDREAQVTDEAPLPTSLSIVGIGASAGGLEAMTAMLTKALPDNMAYVVVQHLAPHHESIMAEILSRHTAMKVHTAADGMKIEPNRIYVIPPNAEMTMTDGHLRVTRPHIARGPRYEVDAFFRSLAEHAGPRALGVILSGTGTDGTVGLQAIKAAGGITFAQNPETARYADMPRSAIDSGFADFVLSPVDIALELVEIKDHPYVRGAPAAAPAEGDDYAELIGEMRRAFGVDLGYYKRSTMGRRIERRMALARVEGLERYTELAKAKPRELRSLFRDILIGVTSFFRDGLPYDVLQTRLFPEMLNGKRHGDPIRIWTPACATGEEVYSVAMCLLETLGDHLADYRVQIFGTDVDADSVQVARNGIYPPSIALDVSPERLRRFFNQRENGYQVKRLLRDMIIFSTQNITREAPFSRMDLISCRNLLIYLQPQVQSRVLRTLHYALQPDGILLLGSSETLGDTANLFTRIDRQAKFYQKRRVVSSATVREVDAEFPRTQFSSPATSSVKQHALLLRSVERQITDRYGPPGVLVNENQDVIQFRGRVTPYLEHTTGAATLNVIRMIHPKLQTVARSVIERAGKEDRSVSQQVDFATDRGSRDLLLEAVPIVDSEIGARCILLLFLDRTVPAPPGTIVDVAPKPPPARREEELEHELLRTREHLQTTIEELETSNEELQSSNEELQSSNEELQSINEEMETSKEELQSSNEELTTINDELQARMNELSLSNDDLHNVLAGLESLVIIVGRNGRIRRLTSSAERTFGLSNEDLGQSVDRLHSHLGEQKLSETVAGVVEKVTTVDRDVLALDGTRYRMRIAPYKTRDHMIQGAVLTMTEADSGPGRNVMLRHAAEAYGRRFLSDTPHPVAVVDENTRLLWVNSHFLTTFHAVPEEVVGERLARVGTGQWSGPTLLEPLRRALGSGEVFRGIEVTHVFPAIGSRSFRVSGTPQDLGDSGRVVVLAFEPE